MKEYIDYDPKENQNIGFKIRAVIRHVNHKKLSLPDKKVDLELGDDNWRIIDKWGVTTPDELSWNWDIIKYKNYK